MYVAIINQPGYLPDTEPVEFETTGEAWQYLAGEYFYHNGEMPNMVSSVGIGSAYANDGYVYSVDVAE